MAGLALNLAKCAFAVSKGILLGHVISKNGMQVDEKKVAIIRDAPVPKTLKQVARFVGQIEWHNTYLRYLSHVCQPLTKMTKKKAVFQWREEQGRAFKLLKKMLVVAPILQPPDWSLEFHIFVDASHIAIGTVLMQEKVKGWFRPI